MRPGSLPRSRTRSLALRTLALAFALPALTYAEQPPDPVEELRAVLGGQRFAPQDQSAYQKKLDASLQKLKSITDLSRALMLPEWQGMVVQPGVNDAEFAALENLTKMFQTRVRALLKQPDDPKAIAVVTLVGAMNAGASTPSFGGPSPLPSKLAPLAPDLIGLAKEAKDPAVRAAAVRTLGNMEADPKEMAAALKRLLTEEKKAAVARAGGEAFGSLPARPLQPAVARAGAAALVERLRASRQLINMPQRADGEPMAIGSLFIPAATVGLGHPDVQVRKSCLEVIRLAARAATESIPHHQLAQAQRLPPEAVARLRQEHNALATTLQPLTLELQGACKPVSAALDADNQEVYEAACKALEEIAEVRRRFVGMSGDAGDQAAGELTRALQDSGVVAKLARKLSHKEVKVQLAAIYVLETLGAEAAQAAKEVAAALADKNPYVRWGAARTAGQMAPAGATLTVPGLAKLLTDEHEDVRLTAAAALERCGPAAKDAVSALALAVKKSEAAERPLAMKALIAVGANAIKDKKEVVGSALRDALKDKDAEVRLTAVRALGRLDPTGKESIEALRNALNDADSNVRRAASEALLAE
jgi:HEAT repeat protein